MLGSKANSQANSKNKKDDFYSSVEEWEAKTFPKLRKKRELKQLENKPDSLGITIANKIFTDIRAELLKHS